MTWPAVKIREATPADADTIGDLIRPLAERFILPECTAGGAAALLATFEARAIRRSLGAGFRYHVAEADGRIVGTIGFKACSHLYHLFVAHDCQRRGIARALLAAAMRECDPRPRVVTVNSSTCAAPVYERLGFVADSGPRMRDGIVYIPMTLSG